MISGTQEGVRTVDILIVRSNGQVTLPVSLRRAAGIEEGDVLTAEVENGSIVLRPKILVDKDQAYFWTERWQAGEREADEDIRKGRVRKFNDVKEMVKTMAEEAGLDPSEVAKD